MMKGILLWDYFRWHYTSAFVSIWRTINNFVYFFYHLFSIPLLLHTLFSPWRRMTESKTKGLASPGKIFERLFGNLLVRFVGVIVRLITILAGTIFCIGVFVCGIIFTIFWLVAPLVVVLSLFVGIRLIV